VGAWPCPLPPPPLPPPRRGPAPRDPLTLAVVFDVDPAEVAVLAVDPPHLRRRGAAITPYLVAAFREEATLPE
jgi:hypothetical protein